MLLSFTNYSFHRPFYESQGWAATSTDDGVLIVLNALGVKKDDIEIKSTEEYVSVYGKTHDEDINRDFEVSIYYNDFRYPVDGVKWDTENGLLKIWVKLIEPKQVKVTRK